MAISKKKILKHIKSDGKEFRELIDESKEQIKKVKGQIKDDVKLKKQLKKK